MIIQADGGLANRLRVILNYREKYGQIDIVWKLDDLIAHKHFLECFEPLRGVRFVDGPADYATQHELPATGAEWHKCYKELRPLPEIADAIKMVRLSGPYQEIGRAHV